MSETDRPAMRYVERAAAASPAEFSPAERAILGQVNRRVAAAESLPRIVDFIFETTRGISPAARISLAFLDDTGRRVTSHYTKADYGELYLRAGYSEDLAGSSLARVIGEGGPRVINDLQRYLEDHPDSVSTRLVVKEGLRSSMTCPLSVEGRRVGLLFRSATEPGAYDDRQVDLWLAIAERISQAVEKAYRIEQLMEANRAYAEMLGFVSHELKSPVGSMVTDARVLVEGYLGELTDKQRDKIGRIIAKGEYLIGLVGEYLDLARIEGGELRAEMRDDVDFVADVIEPALEIVQPQCEAKNMRFVRALPGAAAKLTCDPNLMKIVMVNLLGNAVKYGYEGGKIELAVDVEDRVLRVSVRNEGPGFPPEQASKLFRRFSRLDTPELKKQKGTGVGLYSTWRIVQLHEGRIRARSDPGQWAEFHFHIPRARGE